MLPSAAFDLDHVGSSEYVTAECLAWVESRPVDEAAVWFNGGLGEEALDWREQMAAAGGAVGEERWLLRV